MNLVEGSGIEARLILTAVLVTSKMYNDTYYTNTYIASVGGVSLSNINEMESYFVTMIDWQLHITPEEFDFYDKSCDRVTKQHQLQVPSPQGLLSPTASPSLQAQGGFPVQQNQQPEMPPQKNSQCTLTFSQLQPLEQQLAMQQRQMQASLQNLHQMGQLQTQPVLTKETKFPQQPMPIQQQSSQVDHTYQVASFGREFEGRTMPIQTQQVSSEAPQGLHPYQGRLIAQDRDQMTVNSHESAAWNQTEPQPMAQPQPLYQPQVTSVGPMSNPQSMHQQFQASSNVQMRGVSGQGPQGAQVQLAERFEAYR